MKKEIKSKSRRKWIIGGSLAFASVVLLTTGFATWVITANKKLDIGSTNGASVDSASTNYVLLNMSFDESDLMFSEKATEGKNHVISVEHQNGVKEATPDFTVKAKFTARFGADFLSENELQSISIKMLGIYDSKQGDNEIKTYTEDILKGLTNYNDPLGYQFDDDYNIVTENGTTNNLLSYSGNKVRSADVSNLTYIDLTSASSVINIDTSNTEQYVDGSLTIVQDLNFNWGSFFGNDNSGTEGAVTSYVPSSFYDAEYLKILQKKDANHTALLDTDIKKMQTDITEFDYAISAQEELTNMYKLLDGKKVVLSATLNTNAKTSK